MTTDMRFADKTVADMVLMYQVLEFRLMEAQAKLQETCLQVAGAVWVTAAPDKVVDIQTCVDIVKRIMQEQTK